MGVKIFTFLLFLTGCRLGSRYEAPVVAVPADWKGASVENESFSIENWWDIFDDPELASLEQLVIENNPDLYVALQRVAEARAVAGVAKSKLYPDINLNPGYNNIGELIELYGVPPGMFPGLKTITRVHEFNYQLPVSMSYEVDLWGKFRGVYNAAKIYAEAQDEALRATLLTLTADLASNYFNLRSMDTQIGLIRARIELRQSFLDCVRLQYQSGLVSYLNLMDAEGELSRAQADYQDNLRQRVLFENAIAVLIGAPASDLQIEPFPLKYDPPSVPAGIPSDMLMRRPDLAQAERTMASFHEFIGVAYATYFPSMTLTGALGSSSPDLSQFLRWTSRLWQIGVNLGQILFNGGRNRSEVDLACAKFQETKGMYEKAVLSAFGEVEDALSCVDLQKKQALDLKRSFMAAKETNTLMRLRYKKGIVNYLQTISAEEAQVQAKRLWMNTVGQNYQSTIQLIKALGGGWESPCGDKPASEHAELPVQ